DLLADADLVLAIGTRLGDVPTQGYSFPRAPEPDQPLVHVWPDAEVPGRVFRTEVALVCAPADFCTALAAEARGDAPDRAPWQARIREFMQGVADYSPRAMEDGLDFGAVASALARAAPPQTIVVTDSGNFSGWVHRVWPWTGEELAVGSVGGAMGLGVPGAVAAAMRHPDRCVLGFVGDGGVLMTGNELATAMAQGARPRIVISDNGTYGTIRLHQERDHPGRVAGTDLVNPDFAQWARSFGAGGFVVGQGDDVDAVVRDFLAHDGAAVLHVRASAQAISAFATIDEINRRATASRA
ncbi:thiamine pyrophosphate-dependent enzyme, partial [Brevirhabdus pacifica]